MGPVLTGLKTNWQKLDDGAWGVKLQGGIGEATGHAGRVVSVTNRAGSEKHVTLGAQVDQWNAGRAAVYAVAAKNGKNGKARQQLPGRQPATDTTARIEALEAEVAALRLVLANVVGDEYAAVMGEAREAVQS